MTAKNSSVTPARSLRAAVRVSVPMVVLGAALAAAPAMADTPANWPEPTDGGSFMDHFMMVVAYPVGIAVVIALLVFAPALLGKDKKNAATAEGEWLGGPAGARAGEQKSSDSSGAGGASGKW